MPDYVRPLSPAQQRFIASLAAERVCTDEQRTLAASAVRGVLSSRRASQLIDALSDAPRRQGRVGSSASARDEVPTPSNRTRAGRMLLAGGIEATVTMHDGRHVTIKVRTRVRSGRGWANGNPGEGAGTTIIRILDMRVGFVDVTDAGWAVALRTRNEMYRRAILALFEYAASGTTAGGERVQEASRCGRCFRTLTDPVSIDRGIGPECLGRVTGSQHVERDAITVEPQPTPEPYVADVRPAHFAVSTATEAAHAATIAGNLQASTARARESLEAFADALSTPTSEFTPDTMAAAQALGLTRDQKRARDLIAEALDAYCGESDRDFAMGVFDQLAAS